MDSGVKAIPFAEFPDDVQLCILSFLSLPDISAFACTSKRSLSLCCSGSRLWHALCDRRWGLKTRISQWGSGKISFRLLYSTLNEWDSLIGFWRRSGQPAVSSVASPPQLLFFEWGPFFLAGSRVSPSGDGSFAVVKTPFLWLSLSPSGEAVNILDLDGKSRGFPSEEALREGDLIPVHISFMGGSHLVVEENVQGFVNSNSLGFPRSLSSANLTSDDEEVNVVDGNGLSGSSPDQHMSEMYQYFANRTSPGGNGSSRRQRKREKARLGRRKLEPEHFVKILHCSPTPSRPLQGLWKGIGGDTKLDFYLVSYDNLGGIACRRVWNTTGDRFSGCPLVFWTSKSNYIKGSFSGDELFLYDSRLHLKFGDHRSFTLGHGAEPVSSILYINSSFDLLIPNMAGEASINPRNVEGRIWQYADGTFGFGFMRDNYIIDLKRIAQDGQLLEAEEPCNP